MLLMLSQKRRLKWRKITGKRFYRFEVNKLKSPERALQ